MAKVFQPTSFKRILFFILADIFLSLIALYGSYSLRLNFQIDSTFYDSFFLVFLTLTMLKLLSFYFFKTYLIVWRFFSLSDAIKLFQAHFISYALFTFIFFSFSEFFTPFPRSVIGIDLVLSLFLLGAMRISKRIIMEQSLESTLNPCIIMGVNSRTSSIIKSTLDGEIPYYVTSIFPILERNQSAINTYINNIKVNSCDIIEEYVQKNNIKSAIITADVSAKELNQLFIRLHDAGIEEIKISKILGDQNEKLQDLSIEDLLARYPKDLDEKTIASFIKDKTVLISGAGGSIGSEIALQAQRYGAKKLILVDNSEFNLYQIGEQIQDATLSLISVTDLSALDELFNTENIDIVLHAAAYKHVPLCESNKEIAIYNNVLGSKNIIDMSIKHEVQKVVMISTDKAVRPTNVMGTTKRIAELYAQNVKSGDTEIVAVRFGNVLGSSGSVIPKFKSQIEQGGPVTVTHKEMTRYFMMIPEACQLVLQAASIAKGGELFILDMGEPIKIVDLATKMIELYGKEDEIEITFTGLRAGEKMYEELLINEDEKRTEFESIFIAPPTHYDIDKLNKDIEVLLKSKEPLKQLKVIVPEFNHQV